MEYEAEIRVCVAPPGAFGGKGGAKGGERGGGTEGGNAGGGGATCSYAVSAILSSVTRASSAKLIACVKELRSSLMRSIKLCTLRFSVPATANCAAPVDVFVLRNTICSSGTWSVWRSATWTRVTSSVVAFVVLGAISAVVFV